jgi:hypothetical protein
VALALAGIVLAYLAVTLTLSLLTPAGEANDELDHVVYVEHLLRDSAFPRISAANGHESHQPPLYYLATGAWQKALGIHTFELVLGPATTSGPGVPPLKLSHAYTKAQHQAAGNVHQLRLLSVFFGLCTVLLTFVAARLATGRDSVALAASLMVALWPKEVVVASVVSNDSLVIMLGSLSLVLLLLWLRVGTSDAVRARLFAFDLGLVLGAAVLAKFTALPLVLVAVAVMVGAGLRHRGRQLVAQLLDPVLVVIGCLAVSGWWFLRNKHLYGEYLAVKATNAYMKAWLPPLIQPVSWFNANRFLHFVPSSLQKSVWYDGGWNQFLLPAWVNKVLTAVAAYAVVLFVFVVVRRHQRIMRPAVAAALVGAVLAGVAAVMGVAKDALQAEGRVAFVGLSAFAMILAIGASQAGPLILRRMRGEAAATPPAAEVAGLVVWPIAFLAVDIYVLCHFVLPTRGL